MLCNEEAIRLRITPASTLYQPGEAPNRVRDFHQDHITTPLHQADHLHRTVAVRRAQEVHIHPVPPPVHHRQVHHLVHLIRHPDHPRDLQAEGDNITGYFTFEMFSLTIAIG